MQFTGHSLPVHQSMSVPWDFYLVPFFQPSLPTQNVSLPSGASLWNGMFGWVEGQYTALYQLANCSLVSYKFLLSSQKLWLYRYGLFTALGYKILLASAELQPQTERLLPSKRPFRFFCANSQVYQWYWLLVRLIFFKTCWRQHCDHSTKYLLEPGRV